MTWVYLIQKGDLIKVGRSIEPGRRFRELRRQFGSLTVLGVFRAVADPQGREYVGKAAEKHLRFLMRDFTVDWVCGWPVREWYRLPADDVDYLKSVLAACDA